MEPAKPSRFRLSPILCLAFVAETIAATMETIEGQYLKASGLYCLALAFLLMAAGGASDRPRWRTLTVHLLVLVSIGLLVYRWLVGEGT